MGIDLTTYGKRDAKLISENEGKNPYELKELGLSDKGFEHLLQDGYTGESSTEKTELKAETPIVEKGKEEPKVESNVVKPVVTKVDDKKPMPKLTSPQSLKKQSLGGVAVTNRKTGKTILMTDKAARILSNNKNFDIQR